MKYIIPAIFLFAIFLIVNTFAPHKDSSDNIEAEEKKEIEIMEATKDWMSIKTLYLDKEKGELHFYPDCVALNIERDVFERNVLLVKIDTDTCRWQYIQELKKCDICVAIKTAKDIEKEVLKTL